MIKAVAICRIGQRDHDERGRVIATREDYDTVRDLAGEMYATSTDDVGGPIRETVRAVAELPALLAPGLPITVDYVARQLGVHTSTASRRLADAVRDGWIIHRATRRGRPTRQTQGVRETCAQCQVGCGRGWTDSRRRHRRAPVSGWPR